MPENKNLLDVAHNIANQIWKQYVSQNIAVAATSEILPSKLLQQFKLSWIQSYAPGFYVSSKQVKILHGPQSFYNLLLKEITKAKKRIILSSLYLGTGPLEENLIITIKKKLDENPDVKVKFLLDCSRGSRGEINSRKMLLPLLKSHEKSCQVSLYQTPSLPEPYINVLPSKYKEIAGLQHIKAYLIDDSFIITGANLSNDYFTNRQDRYIFIENCKDLSDYIEGLVDKISQFSFKLNGNDKLSLSETWSLDPLKTDAKTFNFAAATSIKNYYENYLGNFNADEEDTIIFPLLEMGPLSIHQDSDVTKKIFESCCSTSDIFLTTGYFNLTEAYINSIINKSEANFKLLMAHPTANGFYKAEGPAGGIPHAYTYIASKFLKRINEKGQNYRIKMFEYKRPGWTYHAKGLWLSNYKFPFPFLTMIGSPNFGERSVKHDLECQFLIATSSEDLQYEFDQEKKFLYNYSTIFNEETCSEADRQTPNWVKVLIWLFRSYL